MRQFLGIIYFIFLATLCQGQISVKAELSTTSATIADPVLYNLLVTLPQGASVQQVDITAFDSVMVFTGLDTVFEKAADRFEVRDWGRWQPTSGSKILTAEQLQWNQLPSQDNTLELENPISISFWDQGQYVIPPLKIVVNNNGRQTSLKTIPYRINVKTTIPDSTAVADQTDIAPIKDIKKEPLKLEDFLPYILGILGALLLGALIFWFVKRKSNKEEKIIAPVVIKRSAHEIAYEKLDLLKRKELWQKGEVKAYQSELTYIVREYLENRYEVNALENTTDEINKELKKLNLSAEHQNDLSNILQVADLVKFAKATPDENIHDQFMDKSKNFIAATRRSDEEVESLKAAQETTSNDLLNQEASKPKDRK